MDSEVRYLYLDDIIVSFFGSVCMIYLQNKKIRKGGDNNVRKNTN